MHTDLDCERLRTFVTVAETRNFTRAARRLHRVQSAISAQIQRLEAAVGTQLLTRTPRSVTLTPAGEQLLGYAQRMLRLNDEALSTLGAPEMTGVVRMGVTDMATAYLSPALLRYAQSYPRVHLEMTCDRSWHLLNALDRDELDMALVTQTGARTDGAVLLRDPLVWVTGRGGQAQYIDPLPLALFAPGCRYRDAALHALQTDERAWRIAYSSPSQASLLMAVAAGVAVSVASRRTINANLQVIPTEKMPRLPDLALILVEKPLLHRRPAKKLTDQLRQSLSALDSTAA